MNEKEFIPPNASDHDLLIIVHTMILTMRSDLSTLRDDNSKRLSNLENNKASKEDLDKVSKEHSTKYTDIEQRLRTIERNMYIAMGVITVIQIIINTA